MTAPIEQQASTFTNLEQQYSSGTYLKRPIAITHGEGVWIIDEDGNRYLDCIAGIGANVLGHRHPEFNKALHEQIEKTISVPELLCNDTRALYQQELLAQFPSCYTRVFLCNGGAEANEAALKFARVSSGNTPLLSLSFGYHGKTLGALSVTHNIKYREPFMPLYPDVHFLPTGNLDKAEELFQNQEFSPGAFIFEGIQGEGGVKQHDSAYLQALSKRVKDRGGYVVADEVQCGFGRTGSMWSFASHGVEPDFVVLGKAIGNGVPLSAVVLHERVPEIPSLAHTTTFGGNPLSCAAGRAVLRILEKEQLLENVRQRGEQFRTMLQDARLATIREIRGEGLMIGVELKQKAGPYLAQLQSQGVLVLLAGPRVLRILPPYIITEDEMTQVANAFISVLSR